MFHITPDGRLVDDGSSPNPNPLAGLQDTMQGFANQTATGNLPGAQDLPSLDGRPIPAGLSAGPQGPPMPTPGASPLPYAPQLPQPDFSQVPQVKPLSTPGVQIYPTKSSARMGNILQAVGGFREGMQRSESITDRRAANKYKTAMARVKAISEDTTKPDDVKQAEIGAILNDPDVQRGARVVGVELPMEAGQTPEKPGLLKRIGGAVMQGVTGVQRQPAAGKVDVGALPQMGRQEQKARQLAEAETEDKLLWAEAKKRLPPEARDMAIKIAAGVEVSAEDKAKYAAEVQKALLAARNARELQSQRDAAASERQKTGIAATAEQGKVRDEAAERRSRIGAAGRIGAADRAQKKDFGQTGSLRDDYNRDLKQINFPDISSSAARITTAAKNPTPAGDLSVIYSYMKMLDPGSVVRESEFRVAETARPMLERVGLNWNAVKSVWEGKKLTDSSRADFVNKAGALYESAASQKKEIDTHYRGIAERNKLNPQDIIRDAGSSSSPQVGSVVQYQGKPHRFLGVNPDGTWKLGAMNGK